MLELCFCNEECTFVCFEAYLGYFQVLHLPCHTLALRLGRDRLDPLSLLNLGGGILVNLWLICFFALELIVDTTPLVGESTTIYSSHLGLPIMIFQFLLFHVLRIYH